MKNKGLIFLVFALIYSANISAQILKGSSVLYFAEKGHMDAFTPNEPYGSELAFVLEDSTMYRWSRDVSEWAVVTSNKIYVISAAADTSAISTPRMNDIAYVDSTLMFLRDSAKWRLFSGGTPLPDSLVYQSELGDTSSVLRSIVTGLTTNLTSPYVPYWDGSTFQDSPAYYSGDTLAYNDGTKIFHDWNTSGRVEFDVGAISWKLERYGTRGLAIYPTDVSTSNEISFLNSSSQKLFEIKPGQKRMEFYQDFGIILEADNPAANTLQFDINSDDFWTFQRTASDVGQTSGFQLKIPATDQANAPFFFVDESSNIGVVIHPHYQRIGIATDNLPDYALDIGGSAAAIRLNPTTAPTNAEGVIYANDSDDRLRYMDGTSNNTLAYKSELSDFGGYADTVAVIKETTSQSLAATASYLRITSLETTGLAEVITTTDSTLTVPVDGNYRIRYNFSIQIAAAGSGTWLVQLQPYNNAAAISEMLSTVQIVTGAAETWRQVISGETVTTLSAGDEISLRYTATSGPTYTLYPGTITVEKL